jgi:hypothetical protein
MDLGLLYMDGKIRYRPKAFMKSSRFKTTVLSSNCSNKKEVRICPAAHTLFNVQSIYQVLEVKMSSFLFCWKAEINYQNFHETICSNSDVSNDILLCCHQVKRWQPTQ